MAANRLPRDGSSSSLANETQLKLASKTPFLTSMQSSTYGKATSPLARPSHLIRSSSTGHPRVEEIETSEGSELRSILQSPKQQIPQHQSCNKLNCLDEGRDIKPGAHANKTFESWPSTAQIDPDPLDLRNSHHYVSYSMYPGEKLSSHKQPEHQDVMPTPVTPQSTIELDSVSLIDDRNTAQNSTKHV